MVDSCLCVDIVAICSKFCEDLLVWVEGTDYVVEFHWKRFGFVPASGYLPFVGMGIEACGCSSIHGGFGIVVEVA